MREWLAKVGAKTLFIELGCPWESGYVESFDSKWRGELLNGEMIYSIKETQLLIERWRKT